MTDPKVWILYARMALGGALKGQELEAVLDRYGEARQLALEAPVAEKECE